MVGAQLFINRKNAVQFFTMLGDISLLPFCREKLDLAGRECESAKAAR
jgi:hypothetical protein